MKAKLIYLFNNKFELNKIRAFLDEHKSERIAEKFLQLFGELIGENE